MYSFMDSSRVLLQRNIVISTPSLYVISSEARNLGVTLGTMLCIGFLAEFTLNVVNVLEMTTL